MYIVHAIHHTTLNDLHTSLLHSTAYYNIRSCLDRQHSHPGFFKRKNENTAQCGLGQVNKTVPVYAGHVAIFVTLWNQLGKSSNTQVSKPADVWQESEITACRRSYPEVGRPPWDPCVFWRRWRCQLPWTPVRMDHRTIFASDQRHIVGMLGHQC